MKNYADFDDDKIKTDKKTGSPRKTGFSYFSKSKHDQNRQGGQIDYADLNDDKIKTDKKPKVRENPVFLIF